MKQLLIFLVFFIAYLRCYSAGIVCRENESLINGNCIVLSTSAPEIDINNMPIVFPTSSNGAMGIQMEANSTIINDRIDILMNNISDIIISNLSDPAALPDRMLTFKSLLGPGKLFLTKGQLQGAANVIRNGDAILTHSESVFQVSIPVKLNRLVVSYNFEVKYPLRTVSGIVKAFMSNVEGSSEFEYNTESLISDTSLNIGSLKVEVHSSNAWFVSRWLTRILTTGILSEIAIQYTSKIITDHLAVVAKSVNDL